MIENDDLLETFNTISDKVSADIKKNLIANFSTIKKIWERKIKSHVTDFYSKKVLRWTLIILIYSSQLRFCSQ